MLKYRCSAQIEELRKLAAERTVVLLDYDTNDDVENQRKPLSHASLIKRFIENEAAE